MMMECKEKEESVDGQGGLDLLVALVPSLSLSLSLSLPSDLITLHLLLIS